MVSAIKNMLLGVMALALLFSCGRQSEGITFADGISFWTAPTIIAETEGYFDDQKIKVDVARYSSGLAAKNAVVSRAADVGIVANTPLAAGLRSEEDLVPIATYFRSQSVLALVGKANNGQQNGQESYAVLTDDEIRNSLLSKGTTKIGVIAGTISEIFVDNLLETLQVSPDRITKVNLSTGSIVQAFVRGDVEYVSIWEPFIINSANALQSVGDGISVRWSGDEYTVSLHLITRSDVIQDPEKKRSLLKFLDAVNQASMFLTNEANEAEGRALVEKVVGLELGALRGTWDVSGPGLGGRLEFGLMPNPNSEWENWLQNELSQELVWLGAENPDEIIDKIEFAGIVN